MKTIMVHLVVSLLLFYVNGSGALFPRHHQNNNVVNSGNTTLTLFDKIRRFKETFREMIRMRLDELRTASTGSGVNPDGTQPAQGHQVVPTVQQGTAAVPTVHVPPTSTTGVPAAQRGVQTTVAQPAVPPSVPVTQQGAATAPVAQPGAAIVPVNQPVLPTGPVAQRAVANPPVAQSVPVAQPAATTDAQVPASVTGQPAPGVPIPIE